VGQICQRLVQERADAYNPAAKTSIGTGAVTAEQPSIDEQIAEAERMVHELREAERLVEEREWLGKLARLTAIRDEREVVSDTTQGVEDDKAE
jgi:hypothetical protein